MMIYARTAAEPLWGSIILERNVYEAGRGLREEGVMCMIGCR